MGPVLALSLLVQENPSWPYLESRFYDVAQELVQTEHVRPVKKEVYHGMAGIINA
jgi:hypothetical protein